MASNQLVLVFSETSNNPADVVQVHHDDGHDVTAEAKSLPPGTALVTFLSSPINPQDLMAIAGRYPVKPAYRHQDKPIPGNDGVARVEAVGPVAAADSNSTAITIQPGDLVIPRRHGLGTWRRRAVLPVDALARLPLDYQAGPTAGIDPIAAGMLRTVFVPAYLIVEDMRGLRPGDWIIQNAAGSTIAQLVTHGQQGELPDVGPADVVLTESELAARGASAHPALEAAAAQGRVVLALDAVFGQSGEALAGVLSKGGTFVNYGSLGGPDGVLRLTQKLIFWNEIKFRNFRLTEQLGQRSATEQEALLGWLAQLIARGELRAPAVEKIPVPVDGLSVPAFQEKVKQALTAAAAKQLGHRKHVFVFGE
ncbi:hypothetical protein VTH82DRAFT_5786 [Thermothelomyces myriococcoides]